MTLLTLFSMKQLVLAGAVSLSVSPAASAPAELRSLEAQPNEGVMQYLIDVEQKQPPEIVLQWC